MINNLLYALQEIVYPLVVLCIILFLLFIGGYCDTRYSTTAKVLDIDKTSTTFVDGAGYIWAVNDTNYQKGQFVKLYFFNNTTDYTREDDIIVKVKPIKER